MRSEGVDSLRTREAAEVSLPATQDPDARGEQRSSAADAPPTRNARPTRLEKWLLRKVLATLGNPPLTLALWDGQTIECTSEPVALIRFLNRAALWKILADPMFQFGECYSAGTLVVEGNLVSMLRAVSRAINQSPRRGRFPWLVRRWLHRPRGSSVAHARENIHQHYDIGNDFYQLWLDENLVYTCAYFPELTFSLEQAQLAKMDHVCRKLQLQPGERVIEAGCGWGALALHMARKYGVTVRAYNISHHQILYARRRAREEGLDDRVEFVEDDWRHITGTCDAFVSVGMLEHVGPTNYRLLGRVIDRCLTPEGRGLIHSIGRNKYMQLDPWIERRIFPGAYPPELTRMVSIFEPDDFSVLDVENLRLHYAETLKHWLDRFENARDQVRNMFDERFVRMWRLYLAGSIAAFETGDLQLFQIVFARAANNSIPWTRAHLYDNKANAADLAVSP